HRGHFQSHRGSPQGCGFPGSLPLAGCWLLVAGLLVAGGCCVTVRRMLKSTCLLVVIAAAAALQAQAPAAPRVVLVTIDGMRGDYIGNADGYQLKVPNLRRLMREGSFSPR